MKKLKIHSEFLVYITSDAKNKTSVKMSQEVRSLIDEESMKIIHIESFSDMSKAIRKKVRLSRLDENKRIKFVRKKNPHLINLIFTMLEN